MPTYPYRCLNCGKRFEVFIPYDEYGKRTVTCAYCSSENVQRRIVRVRVARSEESRLENLTDPSVLESMEDDPRAMGKMMRQLSNELGEDMGPEFNEVIDRLESGQHPEEIEKELPDLGGGGDDLGDDL
ncbi:MAG: hypothetical protein GX495_00425 [Chloroflexi bacterium]|jgi:putative FmdB family regulatory protein|nr:hypothetical protein [Chloroflexota bacterium]